MIWFSENEQLMSALAGWKGLVRMICFSKNEDRAELWILMYIFFVSTAIGIFKVYVFQSQTVCLCT